MVSPENRTSVMCSSSTGWYPKKHYWILSKVSRELLPPREEENRGLTGEKNLRHACACKHPTTNGWEKVRCTRS